eukprot:4210758-Alexandrium_andersonii.AAC.1
MARTRPRFSCMSGWSGYGGSSRKPGRTWRASAADAPSPSDGPATLRTSPRSLRTFPGPGARSIRAR